MVYDITESHSNAAEVIRFEESLTMSNARSDQGRSIKLERSIGISDGERARPSPPRRLTQGRHRLTSHPRPERKLEAKWQFILDAMVTGQGFRPA